MPGHQIAIDIVLLLSEKMLNFVLQLNRQVQRNHKQNIVLDEKNYLPHISLAMGSVLEVNLSKIGNMLKIIAQDFQPLELKVVASKEGKYLSSLVVGNTAELQSLHEMLMKRLSSHFLNKTEEKMLCPPITDKKTSLYWINNYQKLSAYENFSPHISVGTGQIRKIDFPVSFTAEKIAICHLGDYCSCRKILASDQLGS